MTECGNMWDVLCEAIGISQQRYPQNMNIPFVELHPFVIKDVCICDLVQAPLCTWGRGVGLEPYGWKASPCPDLITIEPIGS